MIQRQNTCTKTTLLPIFARLVFFSSSSSPSAFTSPHTTVTVADGAAAQTMLDPLRYAQAQQREREKEKRKQQLYHSPLNGKRMETQHLMLKRKKK